MHRWRNRQEHVLALLGPGGPLIAQSLLESGFRVSVSVVTEAAARGFAALSLQICMSGRRRSSRCLIIWRHRL